MNRQEGLEAGRVSGLCAGYTMIDKELLETSTTALFTMVKKYLMNL
jgi:hypothetical protein